MKAKQENHLMKVKPYSMFRHSFSRTIKHVHQHRLPCTKEIIFLSLLHSYERTNKQTNYKHILLQTPNTKPDE
jgi:hypothetical protein